MSPERPRWHHNWIGDGGGNQGRLPRGSDSQGGLKDELGADLAQREKEGAPKQGISQGKDPAGVWIAGG